MDDNFEKRIRDIMNDPPDLPFDEQAWDKMQRKLKADANTPVTWKRWLPLLLLSLFALLGGNYFFKYSLAAERVLLLEEQLNFERQRLQKGDIDTLTERHHIVIYDTTYIYTTKTIQLPEAEGPDRAVDETANYLRLLANRGPGAFPIQSQILSEYFPAAPSKQWFSTQQRSFFYPDSGLLDGSLRALWHSSRSRQGTENDTENKTSDQRSTYDLASLSAPLFSNEFSNPAMSGATMPLQDLDKHRSRRGLDHYASYVSPTRYSFGAYFGSNREMNIEAPRENLSFKNNYSAGVRGMLHYGQHFSILLGAEYFRNGYVAEAETDGVDMELYTRGLPVLMPASDQDLFHEVIVDFRYLQIPLALQYRFLPERVIQPYVGLGLMSRMALRSNLEYEYVGTNGIYSIATSNLLSDDFQFNTAFGYLGVGFDLTKHLQLLLEGRFESDMGKEGIYKYEKARFLKLHSGLLYSF